MYSPVAVIDEAAENLGQIIKFPADQIELMFCLLISYPLGFIFKRLRNITLRHCFSIGVGMFYQYLLYRNDIIHPLLLWMFTYLGVKFFGRNRPVLIFVIAMLHLASIHIRVMIEDWGGYKVDVTGSMMLSVCKCTSFAWSYRDGGVDINKLSAEQQKKRIVKLPSLLEYFSFVSFYGAVLAGPAYDYRDYEDFVKQHGDYVEIPRTFLVSFGYLLLGLFNMGLVTFCISKWNPKVFLTKEYAEMGWGFKYLYMAIIMYIHKSRYFAAWLIANANVTAAGLNYNPNGKDVFEKYSKVVAIKPLDYDFKDNIKDRLEAWNTSCQIWLKNYVYFRVASEEEIRKNPAKATFASNVTFMTSAFWHGFYLNFYAAFFFMFLAQQISRSLYRIRHKLRWIPAPIGYFIRWYLSGFCIYFFGAMFALLDVKEMLVFLRAWNFYPYILVFVLFILLNYTPLGKGPRKPKEVADGAKKTETNGTEAKDVKKDK